VNDTVTIEGTLFGIRDANQIALFDKGRVTRFDMKGHAAIHTAPNVRKVAKSAEHPTGYAPICVGTTTSARMERFTRPLMAELGVRLVIGKGGLGAGSLQAFSDLGGAYLAIIGGTAALETTWVEAIEDVDLDDLNPESLWKFRVKGFGPLLVAMDSHGGSLYDEVDRKARARRENTLAKLGVK
jgi:L(+)-tartrate dehydratase beta subunit